MAFDLQRAMAKKGEVESARLDAFLFRLRARKVKLLAERLNVDAALDPPIDPAEAARAVATRTDEAIQAALRARLTEPLSDQAWQTLTSAAEAEARAQLIEEYGDPAPHRMG